MRKLLWISGITSVAIILFSSCKKEEGPGLSVETFSAVGNVASIQNKMNEFRSVIGNNLNTTIIGADPDGRREINWEATADSVTNMNSFPGQYYAGYETALPDMRKRGFLLIEQVGVVGFRVDSSRFSTFETSYSTQFIPFSGKKIFANLRSQVTDVVFVVPGTTSQGYVKGLGIVFIDVDEASTTTIEFFNEFVSLGIYQVPAKVSGSDYSFLGVYFPNEEILNARITMGNSRLGAGITDITSGGTSDLVAMDDVIYSEPKQY